MATEVLNDRRNSDYTSDVVNSECFNLYNIALHAEREPGTERHIGLKPVGEAASEKGAVQRFCCS